MGRRLAMWVATKPQWVGVVVVFVGGPLALVALLASLLFAIDLLSAMWQWSHY